MQVIPRHANADGRVIVVTLADDGDGGGCEGGRGGALVLTGGGVAARRRGSYACLQDSDAEFGRDGGCDSSPPPAPASLDADLLDAAFVAHDANVGALEGCPPLLALLGRGGRAAALGNAAVEPGAGKCALEGIAAAEFALADVGDCALAADPPPTEACDGARLLLPPSPSTLGVGTRDDGPGGGRGTKGRDAPIGSGSLFCTGEGIKPGAVVEEGDGGATASGGGAGVLPGCAQRSVQTLWTSAWSAAEVDRSMPADAGRESDRPTARAIATKGRDLPSAEAARGLSQPTDRVAEALKTEPRAAFVDSFLRFGEGPLSRLEALEALRDRVGQSLCGRGASASLQLTPALPTESFDGARRGVPDRNWNSSTHSGSALLDISGRADANSRPKCFSAPLLGAAGLPLRPQPCKESTPSTTEASSPSNRASSAIADSASKSKRACASRTRACRML